MAKNAFVPVMMFVFLVCVTPAASAGPYGDALGKCLAKSITPEEKTTLLRWSFFMFAAHPAVRDGSSVTPEQRTAISKKTAKIIERLLTQSCAAESRAASKHEGASGLGTSFGLLSQLAITDLLAHKDVTEALTECIQFVDRDKLKQVIVTQER
jgi:hypothetical protein